MKYNSTHQLSCVPSANCMFVEVGGEVAVLKAVMGLSHALTVGGGAGLVKSATS